MENKNEILRRTWRSLKPSEQKNFLCYYGFPAFLVAYSFDELDTKVKKTFAKYIRENVTVKENL